MVNFKVNVYNETDEGIIGAEVIVYDEDGKRIDSIEITDAQGLKNLEAKLDCLDDTYIDINELKDILANPNQDTIINASLFNGIASDRFSKVDHVHDNTNDASIQKLQKEVQTLKRQYLKNSLKIKIGRESDGQGENGTKIEVRSKKDGIYAHIYCDNDLWSLENRYLVLSINGVPYERPTGKNGRTDSLKINLNPGEYIVSAFCAGDDNMNPATCIKRLKVY